MDEPDGAGDDSDDRGPAAFYENYPRYSLVLLLVAATLTGGVAAFTGSGVLKQEQRLATADRVEGTVLETGVEVEEGTESGSSTDPEERDRYYPVVRFEYEHEDQRHGSTNLRPVGRTGEGTRGAARERADRYQPGDRVTVYVPTSDPGEGYLEADRSYALVGATALFGLVSLLLLNGLRGWYAVHRGSN